MNFGEYNNLRIIKKDWIEKVILPSTVINNEDSPNEHFRKRAYGHGIWLGEEDIFFGWGTDGQSLIIIPQKNSIIITLAEQKDVDPLEDILDFIIKEIII